MVTASTKIAGSTAALAAAAATGMASDAAAAPPVPYTQGWEGFYVGGSLGASWLNSSPNGTTATIGQYGLVGVQGGTENAGNGHATNWLAGLQFGHNWQSNRLVYGFEADLKWFGNKKASSDGTMGTTYTAGLTYTYAASTHRDSRVQVMSSFRARVGYDLNGTLPYITAGPAIARIKSSWSFSGYGGYAATENFSGSKTSWVPGVTVGGGVEKQLWDRWSVRAEVLWTKFADQNLPNPVFNNVAYAAHTGAGGAVNFRNDITTASLGLNYRLGAAPAPVRRERTFDSKGWEGFYVGGSLGASWLHSSPDGTTAGFTNVGYAVSGGPDTAPGGNATNIAGGLQFGHNWQAGKFVYGFETDLKWFGGKSASSNGSVTTTQLYGAFQYSASTHRDSRVEALSTFRARFGYDLNGLLPYVTGGVALGRVKSSWSFTGYGGAGGTPNFAATKTSWVPGATVGGGIEKKLSDHWSVRGEVLWTKFADQNLANPVYNAAYAAQTGTGGVINFRNDITTATIGLNYRF